jgi:hypothetical protein
MREGNVIDAAVVLSIEIGNSYAARICRDGAVLQSGIKEQRSLHEAEEPARKFRS